MKFLKCNKLANFLRATVKLIEEENPFPGKKNNFKGLFLELFSILIFYFGILWHCVFRGDSHDHSDSVRILMIVIAVITFLLILFLKRLEFLDKGKKNETLKRGMILMCISLHNILFVMAAESLVRGQSSDLESHQLLGLVLRYILSTVLLCDGIIRREIIFLQFVTTTFILQVFSFLKCLDLCSANQYFTETMQFFFVACCLFFILLIIKSRQSQNTFTEIFALVVREAESAFCIVKGEEVLFSNDAMKKIMLRNNTRRSLLQNLRSINFTRYVKLRDPDATHNLDRSSKHYSAIFRKPLDYSGCIEILRRSPLNEVTVYTTTYDLGENQGNQWCNFMSKEENKAKMNSNIDNIDDVSSIEWRQFKVKFSFVNWPEYKEEYILIRFSDFTDSQLILESENQRIFKENILNCISHELITPLNITLNLIKSAAEEDCKSTSAKTKPLCVAVTSLEKMSLIVFDIVDFLKIETEQLSYEMTRFKVAQLLEEVVSLIKTYSAEKNVGFVANLEGARNFYTRTDKFRLKRILLNVINYILKKNENISLELNVRKNDDADIEVELCIKEQNVNVEKSNVDQTKSGARKIEKKTFFDFGLSISKLLLAKLLGSGLKKYTLNDEETSISPFLLRLALINDPNDAFSSSVSGKFSVPLEIEEDIFVPTKKVKNKINPLQLTVKRASLLKKDCVKLDGRCPTVLIVDDDAFNIIALEMMLAKINISAIKANNGQQAIKRLTNHHNQHSCNQKQCKGIELIFMDLMMPVMDGFECSEELLKLMKSGAIPDIPIIACTANDSKENIEKCKRIGFHDFLSKPLNQITLSSKISKFIGKTSF